MKETYKKLARSKKYFEQKIEQLERKETPLTTAQESILKRMRLDLRKTENKLRRVTPPLHVTEHAILRYLERIMGIDMQKIKEAIMPPALKKDYEQLPSGTYLVNNPDVADNHRILIDAGVIKSVFPRKTHFDNNP